MKNKAGKILKFSFGIVVTLACFWYIYTLIDVKKAFNSLSFLSPSHVILAVICLAADYLLRVYRWSIMLSEKEKKISFTSAFSPFMGSIALNNILPFRLGDVIRSFVFPGAMGISKRKSFISVFLERILDMSTLLVIFGMGIIMHGGGIELPAWLRNTVFLMIFGIVTFFIIAITIPKYYIRLLHVIMKKSPLPVSLYNKILKINVFLTREMKRQIRNGYLPVIIGLSLLVWLFESGLFYFILRGFFPEAGIGLAFLLTSIATMATLAPSSPGYFGPFHLAAYFVVSRVSNSPEQAVLIAFSSHLLLWAGTTIVGVAAIAANPKLFKIKGKIKLI